MSKELDKLVENFDKLSSKAEKAADEKVADSLSAVTRLSKKEVGELFPSHGEQKKLAELMQIVKSADDHNKKVNALTRRAEEFTGIVVKLLERLA